jgi:hypothetical protein
LIVPSIWLSICVGKSYKQANRGCEPQ